MTTAQLKTIIGCLLLTAIIAATLLYKHAQDIKAPLHAGCDDYQTIPLKDVPAMCAYYYTSGQGAKQ